jgi:hypothetical protein
VGLQRKEILLINFNLAKANGRTSQKWIFVTRRHMADVLAHAAGCCGHSRHYFRQSQALIQCARRALLLIGAAQLEETVWDTRSRRNRAPQGHVFTARACSLTKFVPMCFFIHALGVPNDGVPTFQSVGHRRRAMASANLQLHRQADQQAEGSLEQLRPRED